ncbi:hypothetical protein CRG98_042823 [Punica granatum]|uniref:DUF7745 domain-containing protein n=1 Tax=Punica granatum TaxID=22663 RepID=A0A2I0HYL2_PUNGR|nr:hypothetical protein CRG98_042823 [Punica granatum]
MDRSTLGLRLESLTPPRREISRIWRALRSVDRAFIRLILGDVAMLAESPIDRTFLRTAVEFWDPQHAVFNFQGTGLTPTVEDQLSVFLGISTEEVPRELHQGWDHGVRITWLLDWTHLQALRPTVESYQHNTYHGFLLLIFGTLLFPHASNLIDKALAQVVLQAVEGHSCVETLLAETIRSLDYVREVRRDRMRGSLHLLQIWFLAHIGPFCSSHPFFYITDDCLMIARLLPMFRPPECSFSERRQFLEDLTPTQFLWAARWNPGGPMIMGLIRQLGGLRDIPTEASRLVYRILWADSASSVVERFLQVREIRQLWDTSVIQNLYFPEHPTDEEQTFSATSAYVAQFYSQDLVPVHRPRTAPIPQVPPAVASEAESSAQGAMRMELQSIREKRDRLRCVLVDTRAELADYRELQRELAQTCARSNNNRTYTLMDTESEEVSFAAMTHVPVIDLVSDPLLPPPAPTAIPLPLAAFLSVDSAVHVTSPLAMPM